MSELRIYVDDDARFEAADLKQDRILRAIQSLGVSMAKTLAEMKADLQSKLAANLSAIEAETAVDQSIMTLLQGVVAQNAALKQQLVDAIAAGGDPATLQPMIDVLDAQNALIVANTAKVAAAVVANTPAEV